MEAELYRSPRRPFIYTDRSTGKLEVLFNDDEEPMAAAELDTEIVLTALANTLAYDRGRVAI